MSLQRFEFFFNIFRFLTRRIFYLADEISSDVDPLQATGLSTIGPAAGGKFLYQNIYRPIRLTIKIIKVMPNA